MARPSPERHRGVTLIELLVVLGIVATLVGLLLPAVQRVREAAAKTKCRNNLRQIGLALHGHHDAYSILPPGMSPLDPREPWPRLGWLTRLLPFLEQDALWRQAQEAYRIDRIPSANPPHIPFATPVAIFTCPLDPRVPEAQPTHHGRVAALTSYVGVLGRDWEDDGGVLFRGSRVRLTDITDGASNTLAAGERPPSADCWFGWWYAGFGQNGTGSLDMLLGVRERRVTGQYTYTCPPGPYHFGPGQFDDQCSAFHFWSPHAGGANFLLADGSVRFLRYSADPLLPALASRAGGEAIDAPE